MFPLPLDTSAFSVISLSFVVSSSPASRRIFPVPAALMPVSLSSPSPSLTVTVPSTVDNTIDPSALVTRSLWDASEISGSTDVLPSLPTRQTLTATASTVTPSASDRLMPPDPATALTVTTVISRAPLPAPSSPMPIPATSRKPEAITSESVSPLSRMLPAVEIRLMLPLPASTPPIFRSVCAS